MAANKIIMAWSRCKIEIGVTPEGETMASSLTDIGIIKDKSTNLTPADGDVLEAKQTGGILVAREQQDGSYTLATRVIEPTPALQTLLGIGKAGSAAQANATVITTHIVDKYFSVKLTPKNTGAKGIKAPKCSVAYKPGYSEEEGNYADIEFSILSGDAGYWYSIYTV